MNKSTPVSLGLR